MTEQFIISTITPSLNCGKFIEDTVKSAQDQTHCRIEHIIMDGVSNDDTFEILKKYPHLCWISEKDESKTQAINKGFRKCSGDVLAWISADDYYLPEAFKKVETYFKNEPGLKVLVGRAKVVDEKGDWLFDQEEPSEEGFTHKGIIRFWKNAMLPQPALFFRRSILDEIGYLDEKIKSYMDYDFFLRLSRCYKIKRVPDFFACIRLHEGSESTCDIAAGKLNQKLYAISRKYWGRPNSKKFWGHLISYLIYLPRLKWREYYDQFAFAVRREFAAHPKNLPLREVFPKVIKYFWKYPVPFFVATCKTVTRLARSKLSNLFGANN